MADPYEAYRFATPDAAVNPYALTSSPQQFYAPSSSVWGNYRDSAGMGNPLLGAMTGFTAGGPLVGLGTNIFRGLRDGDMDWQNIATFGVSGAKDEQEQARRARIAAVDAWRAKTFDQMLAKLGQQGADVSGDLAEELKRALWAGGEMGDQNAIQNAMTKFQQRVQQYMTGRTRAGQARQVDAMFSDPRRKAGQARRIDAARTEGLADIAESYRIGARNNAFNQARRGTMGSSMDVEQQGDLQRGRDQSAQQLQAGLTERARQYRLGDAQQQAQLKGLIYSDDPNTAAALSRTLEGISNQGALIRENQAIGSQMDAAQSAAATGYSQGIGGALTSASRPLEYYLSNSGSGA